MQIVTIASDVENPFFRRMMVPSCRALGLRLVALRPLQKWESFADKRPALTRYLAEQTDPDELVLFTDAYDALFVRGEAHLLEAYRALGKPIVFSGELNSWPLGSIGFLLYGERPSGPFPYLNSGGFLGRARDLLALYAKYPTPPSDRFELLRVLRTHGHDIEQQVHWSDQYYWTLVHLLERELVGIDADARLFEYYGPYIPDVVIRELNREVDELRARGKDAPLYQREHTRLTSALREPSRAAHIHFAGAAKTVALDMLDEGSLPSWITDVLAAAPEPTASDFRIVDV